MSGWIKLHRKLIDWEWFSEPNVLSVFLYLLLSASHKETKWRGITIKKGECVTSHETISTYTGLTKRQVRTVLDKLKLSGEISISTTNKFTHITITKWDYYQEEKCHSNVTQYVTEMSHNQPPNNHENEQSPQEKCHSNVTQDVTQMSTYKNVKNIENDKNTKKEHPCRAASCVSESLYEPINSTNSSKEPLTKAVKQQGTSDPATTCHNEFDKFWAAYPKKMSKGAARKAFKTLNPSKELVAIMINHLARAKNCYQWTKDEGQFIPYPATWLRAEGWLDEIPECKNKGDETNGNRNNGTSTDKRYESKKTYKYSTPI